MRTIAHGFRTRLTFASLIALLSIAALAGCGPKTEAQPAAPARVTVSRPIQRQVVQWDEYSGNLSSPDVANVSARVSGLIEQASFREGAIVRKGDLLFVIDPRPFQADVDSKKAAVAQAQAQADQAEVHFRRYSEVRNTRAVSADDYDQARASNEVAQAQLSAARAALENSKLNFEWTKVTAPITGRVSRKYVQAGNLVNGGSGGVQPTLLTSIVSIDPIYCYVQVPEAAAVRYEKLSIDQGAADIAHARIRCYLQLSGETGFPHAGLIDFVDNQVDTGTGTVTIRGVFSNPNGVMTSGMFARLRVPGSAPHEALLIPDAAINSDQNERFVFVVGNNDVVRRQPVQPGPLFGNLRQIDGGLKLDEPVIVDGVQKAKGGAKVEPHEVPVSTQSLDEIEATGQNVSAATEPSAPSQPTSQPGPSRPAVGETR
jgi:RND family efflux transporter MFP subunit